MTTVTVILLLVVGACLYALGRIDSNLKHLKFMRKLIDAQGEAIQDAHGHLEASEIGRFEGVLNHVGRINHLIDVDQEATKGWLVRYWEWRDAKKDKVES